MTVVCETAVCIALLISGVMEQVQPPPVEEMPLYATAYNWELGGINCDHDCGVTAIGVETRPELLGRVAACPSEWIGTVYTTVITLADGSEWWCIDTFGEEKNRKPLLFNHPYYGAHWVLRVDFAVSDPLAFWHNQELLYGWSLEWRPVSELE